MEGTVIAKSMGIKSNGNSKDKKNNQDIRTPLDLFQSIHEQFDFTLDPCDSNEVENWLGIPSYNLNRGENGLELPWTERVFINPPWGRIKGKSQIPLWIDKAFEELESGRSNFIVFLLPSRVETEWFHNLLGSKYLMNHTYLRSRVHFENQAGPYIFGISIFTLWRKLF